MDASIPKSQTKLSLTEVALCMITRSTKEKQYSIIAESECGGLGAPASNPGSGTH